MCILLGTTTHPEYPLILLSNRDEYFKRPTQPASYRPSNFGHHQVLAPRDLGRPEHGTWIGMSTDGKLAVLLNYREGDSRNLSGKLSRGVLPIDYLASEGMTEDQWREDLHRRTAANGQPINLGDIGGFSLVYGQLTVNPRTGRISPLSVLTNRGESGKVFRGETPDDHFEVSRKKTFGISNSVYYLPWRKVAIGEGLVDSMVENAVANKTDQKGLIDACFDVLSYDTYNPEIRDSAPWNEKVAELQNSVFIPPLNTGTDNHTPVSGRYYGTRCQTVILVDHTGQVTYVERDLHNSDDLGVPVAERMFSFAVDLKRRGSVSYESAL